uniref:CCHC-type domain-containing protein n=1 Tax=Caenorhabditis japonica TaxID=281687 RepID=A0A8R1ICZ1_CAEJA
MSVRQAEKDVEVEVGHVEEKNVVVEVEDSVTGGESDERLGAGRKVSVRGRRKLVKGFAQWLKNIEQVSEKVEKDLVVLTKCTKRQREGIIGPLKEFASELLERFEEMGADRWPRSVLRVMKDFDLENVQDIRQVCEKVCGEACSEANESKDAEKVDKIDRKYQKLKSKLSECQINWEVERKNLLEELESEREKAQKLSESQERLKRKVVKLEKALVAEKQVSEDMKSHLKVWQERSKDDHGGKQKIHETWRKPRRTSRSSTNSSEASSWENRSETKTDTSRRSEVREMMDGMRRMMRAQALPEPGVFDGDDDFGEFKRTFLLKYNNVTEGPEEMVAILEDKFLKGPAKTLFKTLPNRHNRSIKALFEEFERKLRKRQGDSRTKALNEFENLRKSPNQKMWEYLIDVEKWSRKAYPGVDEGNLSQMRTTKLMMAVKDNENLYNLLIMKRLDYSIENQYENLKDVVLQQEQEKRQSLKKGHSFLMNEAKMRKDTSWRRSDYQLNQFKEEQKDEMGFRKEENQSQPDIKCFRCGGIGHMSRQCTSKPAYVVERKKSEESEGVGAEVIETVEILGQNRKIIIDSGAVVSVMSS